MSHKTITVTFEDDDGNEVSHELPAKNEVCERCEGDGKHVNPAVECEGGGITGSEMAEILAENPDFMTDYMGGTYDIRCEVCNGEKVILVVDEDAVEMDPTLTEIYKAYCEQQEADAAFERESAAERRMGA